MRIGIVALLHESNTFIRRPTTLDHFRENLLLTGETIRERLKDSHHELGGMFSELDRERATAVPVFAARAIPYGPVSAETYDYLLKTMFSELDRAGKLDGILVAPHGATVSERHLDADGYWLSQLRSRVGKNLPIFGTLDPHANLSQQMIDATNGLVAYRTNPHLDQKQRGQEAARLMVRTLRGEIRPTQAAAFPPMAINIERQNTAEPHCRELYSLADSQLKMPGVLSNSILLGFPYADVPEMGSSAIVITNGDEPLARRLADELGDRMWSLRERFRGQLIDVPTAVAQCRALAGPVCLLDMGDNVGGGSPADGTILAHELRRQGVGPSLVCLYDPEVVQEAKKYAPGTSHSFRIGGKSDSDHGAPLEDTFRIKSFQAGEFEESQPRHGGFTRFDQGETAVLENSTGLTVLVNSVRTPPFSLGQLTSCGLVPESFQTIVAKGVNAPVAAYAPVCPTLLRVNTPGVTCADMTQLAFSRRRNPLFPFENVD